MTATLLALEWRALVRDRLAVAIGIVLIAACALAFVNGRATIEREVTGRADAQAAAARSVADFRAGVAKGGPPEATILHAVRLSLPVIAPLPPLADLAAGRSRFDSDAASARLRARPDTLFARAPLDNPEIAARGGFDLTLVAVMIAPLLLIGFAHGVFAADRDRGTARLLIAQGGSPLGPVLVRLGLRFALVAVPIGVTALLLWVTGPELPGRAAALGNWLALALAGLLLWAAAILFVNSLRVAAETAALALLGGWALLTLAAPPAIGALAQVAYPPPSRLVEIAAARQAEIAATEAYENDHADLATKGFEGRLASVRKTLAIGRQIDAATAPVAAGFAERFAAQRRFARTAALVVPPLVQADALAAVAGTGADQARAFRAEAASYLARLKAVLGRSIDAGQPLSLAAYDALPRFAPAPVAVRPWAALAYLLVLTAVLGALGARRLARAMPA